MRIEFQSRVKDTALQHIDHLFDSPPALATWPKRRRMYWAEWILLGGTFSVFCSQFKALISTSPQRNSKLGPLCPCCLPAYSRVVHWWHTSSHRLYNRIVKMPSFAKDQQPPAVSCGLSCWCVSSPAQDAALPGHSPDALSSLSRSTEQAAQS